MAMLGLSSCGNTYVEPNRYAIGLHNGSATTLSALKIETREHGIEYPVFQKWILTEKQFGTNGEVYSFTLREAMSSNVDYCRVILLDISNTVIVDTTLTLDDNPSESLITYLLKYKADKTLELETIIKPL